MRNTMLDETQAGIKFASKSINNLGYANVGLTIAIFPGLISVSGITSRTDLVCYLTLGKVWLS